MRGSVYKRCGCKDPATGKPLGAKCPDLTKRRHGSYVFDAYLDTSDKDGRRLRRAGHPTQRAAESALDHVRALLRLAGTDDGLRRRVGDLIFSRSKRGGQLPDVEEVRRKLGAGGDLDAPSATVAEWLEEWLASKRRLKESTRETYRGHLDHFLIPLLGQIPRDRLRVEHIAGLFDRIDEWNAELVAAREEDRAPDLPDDTRMRPRVVGNASQHRILATLRNAYNVAVKRPGMIDWNPCLAIELPPEERDPARVWSPEQVAAFFESSRDDRLALLYRIVLLRGLRRGEACGLRWSDLDDDDQGVTIAQTVLEVNGRIVFDTPKTKSGRRWVSFDAETVTLLGEHRKRQRRERFAAGEAYTDHGLIFCREDGAPLQPGTVSWRFRKLSTAAGLQPITLHEGRHTAASLGLEAGLDIKIVSDQLGHSTTSITQDLYTHVRRAVHGDAAEKIVNLLPKRGGDQETGS